MSYSTTAPKALGADAISVSHFAPGLREQFLAPGADLARMRYEGEFGERTIRSPELLTATGRHVIFDLSREARQEFTELCTTLLELRFPFWHTAEGAEGCFVWDLASDRMTHTHALRVLPDAALEELAPLPRGPEEDLNCDLPF